MHCVGTLSWSGMGLGWLARPQRHPDGKELVRDRFQSGLAVRPSEEELSCEISALAPAVRPARSEADSLEIDWAQIRRRCMDGDSNAWTELVRAQHRRVYGLCYCFTRNPPHAR